MEPIIIGSSLNKPDEEFSDAELEALEIDESVDEQMGVHGVVQRGDTFRGMNVDGTGHGFCPFCRMHLPWKFLVVRNNLNYQSLGYCCSSCLNPLIVVTKLKGTSTVVKKWIEPELAAYTVAHQRLWLEKAKERKRRFGG